MKFITFSFILSLFICIPSCSTEPVSDPEFLTATGMVEDTSRSWFDGGIIQPTREIPIKVYAQDLAQPGPFPLIMVSHGLAGNLETITYLCEELLETGYIVVVLQHHGSDTDYLLDHGLDALKASAGLPATRLNRPLDMSFVLDKIIDGITGIPLLDPDRIDFNHIGVMGHSFGAFTTLACLGATFDSGTSASDSRFDCGVAFSPQGPGTLGSEETSWDNISLPAFTMAGTDDTSIGTEDPSERRIAYDRMPNGNKYHATFLDAEHDDFGNIENGFYHDWIIELTLAFFNAYLKDSSEDLSWLQADSINTGNNWVVQEHK